MFEKNKLNNLAVLTNHGYYNYNINIILWEVNSALPYRWKMVSHSFNNQHPSSEYKNLHWLIQIHLWYPFDNGDHQASRNGRNDSNGWDEGPTTKWRV